MTAANKNVTENGDEIYKAPMGLKLLVVGLGIGIILMLGLIIVKVIAGDHKKPEPAGKEALEKGAVLGNVDEEVPARSSFSGILYQGELQDLTIVRPEGAELISYAPNGLEIVLRFKMTDGSDLLLAVNRATGKQTRLTIPK